MVKSEDNHGLHGYHGWEALNMEIRMGTFLVFLRAQHPFPFQSGIFEIDQKR